MPPITPLCGGFDWYCGLVKFYAVQHMLSQCVAPGASAATPREGTGRLGSEAIVTP
jgi:hypothetical protein